MPPKMRKKCMYCGLEAFGISLGKEATLSRISRVCSETLKVVEWVLEFRTRPISLTGLSFFLTLLFEDQRLMIFN